MTYVYPSPVQTNPYLWNGPVCPSCGRGYTHATTTTFTIPHVPKHRKPGPAH
jgi:hypothetical protein